MSFHLEEIIILKTLKLSAPLLFLTPLVVFAQSMDTDTINPDEESKIERIVVTADLSERDLYQLAGSNYVLSNTLVEAREARHIQDVLAAIPNVNFTSGSSRGKFVQIRGIGERSQFSEPINPSIGLMLDDIDISGLGSLATIYDLQQVEVLSGPQSVATGINSLGGVVKLVSNPAVAQENGRFTVSLGQQGAHQIGGAYGTSIGDGVSAKVSAQINKEDGDINNAFLNRDDTNNINERTATFFLTKEFEDDRSIEAKLYYFDIDNGYDAFSLDNDNITQSDEPGFDKTKAYAASIQYQQKFNDVLAEFTLTHLDGEFDYGYDEDWTFPAFHPFTYSSFDRYYRELDRQTIKAQFSNQNQENNNWLAGVQLNDSDESLLREYTFNPSDFTTEYEPRSFSVYGQYEYDFNDRLRTTIASRFEKFTADYADSEGFVEVIDDNLFAASVSLDYALNQNSTDDTLAFIGLSRGYKAGGFNPDQRLQGSDRRFDPEYNWNVELGLKGSMFAGIANYQLTAFHMKRDDAQVSDFATFENVSENGSVVTSFTDAIRNSDSGVNQGIEFSSTWRANSRWQVLANLGYLDATFGGYTRLDGSLIEEQEQAQAPSYTVYLSSEYALTDNWSWFVDVDTKDEFRLSDGHEERSPSTIVLNTNISWQKDSHLVRIWLKNITDERIFTRGFGGFSNDPRDEYAFVEPYFQFGQPRQAGVSYEYRY